MNIRIGIGFNSPDITTEALSQLPAVAATVGDLGFDSLWTTERVSGPGIDPVVALAVIAAGTRSLRLGPSVLTLPGRQPALVAKQIASIDALAPGRVIAAFGLGQRHPLEQQAFGVARDERADMFEEALPLVRRFWTGEAVRHDGRFYRYNELRIRPVPTKRALDVWMGGASAREYDRIARLADGWLASYMTPTEAGAVRHRILNTALNAGRQFPDDHFGTVLSYAHGQPTSREVTFLANRRVNQQHVAIREVIPVGIAELRRCIEAYVENGVTKFVLLPLRNPRDWTDELNLLKDGVLDLQTDDIVGHP
jgi:probable F420-dependent oxidoreductase